MDAACDGGASGRGSADCGPDGGSEEGDGGNGGGARRIAADFARPMTDKWLLMMDEECRRRNSTAALTSDHHRLRVDNSRSKRVIFGILKGH